MNPLPQIDGAEIRRKRLLARISQAQLAEKIGVSQSLISRWEKGSRHKLTEQKLSDLAIALNLDLEPSQVELVAFYCPNFFCPAAYWVRLNTELRAIPMLRHTLPSTQPIHCGYCGTPLKAGCDSCKAPVVTGHTTCRCKKIYAPFEGEIPNDDEKLHNAFRSELLAQPDEIKKRW